MKVAIHGRVLKDQVLPQIQELLSHLSRLQIDFIIYHQFAVFLNEKGIIDLASNFLFSSSDDLDGIDLFLSVGGDGTLLESVTFAVAKDIPVMGINAGRLGFLATMNLDDIAALALIIHTKEYIYEQRTLLELRSTPDLFGSSNFALNEFSITKQDTSSMIVVHTYINGQFLNSYWADGLIISTPTGSTAYALSCGGPVIMPDSNSFVIAPISPHNLNVRPLIVDDNSLISFRIEGRSRNFLISLDSRSMAADADIELSVARCSSMLRLARPTGHSFLETLRKKLNWGVDFRN